MVGDVNEGEILVTKKACVRLIDCDSFQVQTRDKIYHCEVGVVQFLPPCFSSLSYFQAMLRTQNHDNFGLAILIFLLLFMGSYRFLGVYKGGDCYTPIRTSDCRAPVRIGQECSPQSDVPAAKLCRTSHCAK